MIPTWNLGENNYSMREVQGKKILILVWPEISAYNATLRLSRVLIERGNQVVYAVPDHWQEFIKRQGFETVIVKDVDGRTLWQTSAGWLKGLLVSREVARQKVDELCASLAWIKSGGFSLVLLYVTLWQYAPALLYLGIPYLAINACLGGVANAEIPPIFSSLPPAPRHPLQNRLAWLCLYYLGAFNHRYRGVLQATPKNWAARLGDFGKAARHLFLTITEPLRLPVYYRLLLTARQAGARIGWGDYGHRLAGPELILGPEALDFPRQEQPPDRLYAGACVDSQRAEDTFDWSRLDNLRPVVYCTIGSHIDHWNQENRIKLVEAVVQAFTAHPEWQLILQLTGKDAATLTQLPENIKTAAWFPQLQAMQRASLVICHGGFGTLREALFYGVPLIVYPLGVDQPGNAARVAYHHLGLAGDIRTVNPQEIESKVNTVLNDPSYRANAIRIGQSLRADNDCENAVDFLETFIESMHQDAAAM